MRRVCSVVDGRYIYIFFKLLRPLKSPSKSLKKTRNYCWMKLAPAWQWKIEIDTLGGSFESSVRTMLKWCKNDHKLVPLMLRWCSIFCLDHMFWNHYCLLPLIEQKDTRWSCYRAWQRQNSFVMCTLLLLWPPHKQTNLIGQKHMQCFYAVKADQSLEVFDHESRSDIKIHFCLAYCLPLGCLFWLVYFLWAN